jgi:hypothetical protein
MASKVLSLIRFSRPKQLVAHYMESKIPLPTDNIYKFIALFSLILFISGFGTVIYATNATNAMAFEHWVEVETLRALETPTLEQATRLQALEKKIEVAVDDKDAYRSLAIFMIAAGTVGMVFGFGYWHLRIQPRVDQMAATQLEIAKLQLLSLKADLRSKGIDVDKP